MKDIVTQHGININQLNESEVKDKLKGRSGSEYSLLVSGSHGISITISLGQEIWAFSENPNTPILNNLQYMKKDGEKMAEYGGHNTGETERIWGRSYPEMRRVDVFEKYQELLEDLSA